MNKRRHSAHRIDAQEARLTLFELEEIDLDELAWDLADIEQGFYCAAGLACDVPVEGWDLGL